MNIFVGKICDFCSKPLPINFVSTKCSKCPTVFDKCLTCCASSTQDYNICHKQHFTDNTKILKKIDFCFKEFLNIRKMNSLLKTFETPLTDCLRTFAQFLASRHSSIKDVEKELKAFLNDPKTVASKISAMKKDEDSEESEQEVKTQMVDDDESEQVTKKKTIVLENESSSDDSDEKPKKASASKHTDDSEAPDDDEEKDEKEDASDASEPPAVEEDEEDEPKPKSKKAAAAKAKPAPAAKAKGKTTKAVSGEMELSDTPKLPVKDRPTLPKSIKFLKGTNNVVHNGVVVAAVSKKGLGKLTKTNIKPLDEKGIKYKEMTDAEIKKLFKIK